jgi:hypothetical protein
MMLLLLMLPIRLFDISGYMGAQYSSQSHILPLSDMREGKKHVNVRKEVLYPATYEPVIFNTDSQHSAP